MQVNEKILRAFANQHIPATGFVIEQYVQELGVQPSTKMLKEWIRPGFDLGNHMYSHPDVNSLSAEQVEQEITQGDLPFKRGLRRFSTTRNGYDKPVTTA
jgi:peptidoglycan/xylan/chitin deacetylase (PgdA/CDA1 family)